MPEDPTPDVIDGARFLNMSKADAMREVGITSEADYARAYKDVEQVVKANRNNQASIVIKRAGRPVIDVQ